MTHALLPLAVAAALSAAGCSQSGTYTLTWQFKITTASGAEIEKDAASSCGAHGVRAVRITGSEDGGGSSDIVVRCTPGVLTQSVSPGNSWHFKAQALDGLNHPLSPNPDDPNLNPKAQPDGVSIGDGQAVVLTAIRLGSRGGVPVGRRWRRVCRMTAPGGRFAVA